MAAAGRPRRCGSQASRSSSACRSMLRIPATADTSAQVAAVRGRADLLAAYHDATYDQTISFVSALTDADLAKVVDRRWDPP